MPQRKTGEDIFVSFPYIYILAYIFETGSHAGLLLSIIAKDDLGPKFWVTGMQYHHRLCEALGFKPRAFKKMLYKYSSNLVALCNIRTI